MVIPSSSIVVTFRSARPGNNRKRKSLKKKIEKKKKKSLSTGCNKKAGT